MNSLAIVVYLGISFVILCGFFAFVWWWKINKFATPVYVYFTIFLFFECLHYFIHLYLRLKGSCDLEDYTSYYWLLILIPILISLTLVVLSLVKRIFDFSSRSKYFLFRRRYTPKEGFMEEIIVVDDSEIILDMIVQGLTDYFPNIKIYTATNGEEAMSLFSEHKDVNLVITDILLPGMNGFDFCAQIRKTCPWTIVIGMTGYPVVFELWKARENGFDDYLEKPFRIIDLAKVVEAEFKKLERWKTIRDSNRINKKRRKTDG